MTKPKLTAFTTKHQPRPTVLARTAATVGSMTRATFTKVVFSVTALFGAGDLLRRVSLVAYRTRRLADATSSSIGSTERVVWERNGAWQPAREALEKLLTAYDWRAFDGDEPGAAPTLDQVLIRQLAKAARDNNDDLTWLLLGNLAADADRCTRWSLALARYAIEQRAGNKDVLRRWVARWTPRAEAAAAGLSQLFKQSASGVRSAQTVENAANSARRRLLNEAGLAG